MKTGAQILAELRNQETTRIMARATLKFTPSSLYFRIRCNETMVEEDFSTLRECLDHADKTRHTMADESLSFTLTRVRESEAEY